MSEFEQSGLVRILTDPRESLTVEYKSWLDLGEDKGKAKLAKAAIALANMGGGRIVVGIRQGKPEEQDEWISESCPPEFSHYTEDAVGAAIGKYSDPVPECRLEFAVHPKTGHQHAIVTISGGHTEPVIAKKPYGKELHDYRCYIRKLGPARSEEPNTALEWRELFRRCVLSQRETMIDAFRGIIDGRVTDSRTNPTDQEKLTGFAAESRDRWQDRTMDLPDDDTARLNSGYHAVTFVLQGIEELPNLTDVKALIDNASRWDSTGYGPFWYGSRLSQVPQPIGDSVEAWQADPINDVRHTSMDVSFWRASRLGQFYCLEGFYEDSGYKNWKARTYYDVSESIRRFGSFLMFASKISHQFDAKPDILFHISLSGLKSRRLVSERVWFLGRQNYVSIDDTFDSAILRTTVEQVEVNLEEILHKFLFPLYEQFSFYQLNRAFVAAEIEILRKRGY